MLDTKDLLLILAIIAPLMAALWAGLNYRLKRIELKIDAMDRCAVRRYEFDDLKGRVIRLEAV